jgi:hypothetical protein
LFYGHWIVVLVCRRPSIELYSTIGWIFLLKERVVAVEIGLGGCWLLAIVQKITRRQQNIFYFEVSMVSGLFVLSALDELDLQDFLLCMVCTFVLSFMPVLKKLVKYA